MRKTRNPLLQMDEANQAQLAEWLLDGMPYHIAQPQVEKEYAVKAGKDSFSSFWQEVCVPLILNRRSRAVETADAVATEASKQPGRFDQATIDALKQKAFDLSIAPHADPKDVKSLMMLILKSRDQDIRQSDVALKLRRLELLETQAAAAKEKLTAVKTAGGLSPESLALIEQAAGLL
jgi:hypothetical protein